MKLAPLPIPPHFQYYCIACDQVFGSAERAPYAKPVRDPFQPYYCEPCATVENQRSAA